MIALQVIISVFVLNLLHYYYPHKVLSTAILIFFSIQVAAVWSYSFYKFKLGVIFRAQGLGSMLQGYLITLFFGSALFITELYILPFLPLSEASVLFILIFILINFITLIAFKLAFYYFMRYVRRRGHNSRNVVLIADSENESFIKAFITAKDWGWKLYSIVSTDESLTERYDNVHIIKTHETLLRYLMANPVDDVFYCMAVNEKAYDIDDLLEEVERTGITVHIRQQNYIAKKLNVEKTTFNSSTQTFLTYQTISNKYYDLKIKELFDLLFSILVLFFITPLLLIIALLIKLEDGGPVFFKQQRIGLNGRRFICFKFRSMIVDADKMIDQLQDKNESDGPTFKIENDPRITCIGRIIRKTSLDELPQFYNVLKGEMSVVGPRPPLLKEVKQYEKSQLRRLSMKPGITCIWQVYGRNIVSFDDWMRMDLEYIDNWSLKMDMKLIFNTVAVVFKANGR